MKADIKTKWVRALRSGRYKQTTGQLYDGQGYCCLGVLCKVMRVKQEDFGFVDSTGQHSGGTLTETIRNKAELLDEQESKLVSLNDGQGKSFAEIATYIEENL